MGNDSKKIRISLEFGGAILPIVACDSGKEVVPLKPIVDEIGAQWERQRKRVSDGYLAQRLGTYPVQMYWAGQQREMVCIRLDRVTAYLNSLNPDSIRSAGNEDSADFLERKHEEWDDVLHAYESQHGILVSEKQRRLNELNTLSRKGKNRQRKQKWTCHNNSTTRPLALVFIAPRAAVPTRRG